MAKWDPIWIDVVNETELLIYIHDEREEYFLHYDHWPNAPVIHQIDPADDLTNIMVQKKIDFHRCSRNFRLCCSIE